MTMTNAETIALTKAVNAAATKAAREGLAPGKYEVDALVRITGTMKVGEDYEQEFWQIAKPERTILALVCALNGTTADKITQEQYEHVLADVEGRFEQISDEEAKRFKADREKHLKTLREPTKKVAKGKVTGKITAEKVDGVTVEQTAPVQTTEKVA